MWHEIISGSKVWDLCDFSSDPVKISSQKFITANIFPAKIYFRVNILSLKFARQKCSTKQLYLFNYNLSLSFRNDACAKFSLVFAGLRPPWYCLDIIFSLHVLNKNDNIINDLSGTF